MTNENDTAPKTTTDDTDGDPDGRAVGPRIAFGHACAHGIPAFGSGTEGPEKARRAERGLSGPMESAPYRPREHSVRGGRRQREVLRASTSSRLRTGCCSVESSRPNQLA